MEDPIKGNKGWQSQGFTRHWRGWAQFVFFLTIAAAFVWFLCRVLPKPIRATYPCQRAAFPLATAFIIWLLGFKTSLFAWFQLKDRQRRWRPAMGAALVVLASGLLALGMIGSIKVPTSRWASTDGPNAPVGSGKGIYSGRVAWAFDPAAVSWNSSGNWWSDTYNSQTNIDRMLSKTIRSVGGRGEDGEAWDNLFRSFNQRVGRGNVGYAPGQIVAVKINMNNTSSHANNNNINASPHLVLSLLRQLVRQAGVPQTNIIVFDASRYITDNVYGLGHAEFPNVVFLDNSGGDGRAKSTCRTNAIRYSINHNLTNLLTTAVTDSHYLINMALLKGHGGQGVTFCGKNYYGTLGISSDYRQNRHDYFNQPRDGSAAYMTFTDFLGHKDLGGKTMLFIMDGLYGCKTVGGSPQPKWQMAPFNNRWPSSIFVSQDGVAVDSVALDFFRTEFPEAQDIDFADTYLHESALAHAAPSGTRYDPERDGSYLSSLGVHEHWNDEFNMQYSGNLGLSGGIELVAVHAVPGMNLTIANPIQGTIWAYGTPLPIVASVSNTHSTIREVEFRAGTTLVGKVTNSPYGLTWTNAPVAAHNLTAVAIDTDGLRVTSAVVTVSVQIMGNVAPAFRTNPVSQTAPLGGVATFWVNADGWPIPSYQWCKDGLAIPGAANAVMPLNNVTEADIGSYWAVATNLAGRATSAVATLTVTTLATSLTLVPAGARWKYFDLTNDLGSAWRAWEYNDNSWSNGFARLGYGGDGEVTRVNSNRFRITTYLRHSFLLSDTNGLESLSLRMQRDDAAVVYLNGLEIWRDNLSNGVVTWFSLASNAVAGADETNWFTNTLSASGLRIGTNLFAVEIHQNGTNSSDLGFNFEATGLYPARSLRGSGPRITADFKPDAKAFQFSFFGQPGRSYHLLCSTNLTDWLPSSTWNAVGGFIEGTRDYDTNSPKCFYRLASP
jgi:hypothetical protein